MKLTHSRSITAASRRFAIAAVVLLGTATCAAAMTLRLEVPAQAIPSIQTPTPMHAIIAAGAEQANGPIRISGGVASGQIISKVAPVYPPEAKEKGIQGTVVLHAIIGKDGTIQQLAVISGPEELQASAMEAVKQWVYKPYLLNGEPVEVETTITVNYALGNSAQPQADNTNQDAREIAGSHAQVHRVGGSVVPPVAIYTPDPQFSEEAREAKASGKVVVSLVVDRDGQPQNVHVIRGAGMGLDEKAVEAVQQYRFKPATQDGKPVPVYLNIEVNFQYFRK